jgi:hypothetical protein
MHKHFSRFERIFLLLAIRLLTWRSKLKSEINDDGVVYSEENHTQLGGNYALKVARYYSLNSLSYWL